MQHFSEEFDFDPTPKQIRELRAAFRLAIEAGHLMVLPEPAEFGPSRPSGLRDETECPANHDDADVVRNGCYSCGAAV